MIKRVEHNNSMLKSNVPCFKFIALLAIVFNSFLVQGAQNFIPVLATPNGNTPGTTNLAVPAGNTLRADSVYGKDSVADRTNGVSFSSITNAVAALRSGDVLKIRGTFFANTFGQPSTGVSNGGCFNIIGKSNIVIEADGYAEIQFTNNSTGFFLWDAHNITIRGLTFNWTNKPAGTSITNLIGVINMGGRSSDCKFLYNRFLNYPNHGVGVGIGPCELAPNFGLSTNVEVAYCYFLNGGQISGVSGLTYDGAAIVPGPFWNIHDNIVDYKCLRGVEIYRPSSGGVWEGIEVRHNIFRGLYGGAVLLINTADGTANNTMLNIDLIDNIIYDRTPGGPAGDSAAFYGGAGGFTRVKVERNTFDLNLADYSNCINWQSGVNGGNIIDCEIRHNIFNNCQNGFCLVLGDTTGSTKITNCIIANNEFKLGVFAMSIYTIGMSGSFITGNNFEFNGGTGNIYMDNVGGVGRNNFIGYNFFDQANAASIYLEAGVSNCIVMYNETRTFGTQPIRDQNPLGFNTIDRNSVKGISFHGTNNLGPIAISSSLFNLWTAGSIVTNTLQTTNNMITGTGDGTLSLGVDYWKRSKGVMLKGIGRYWTATPGGTRMNLNYDIAGVTTSNTITTTYFTPPASVTAGLLTLEISITCTNVGTSGALIARGKMETVSGNTPTTHTFTNTITTINTIANGTLTLNGTNGPQTGIVFDDLHLIEL